MRLLTDATGRERHTIEDPFSTLKNNGIGMEHVFCAEATASKNLYSLMQIAFMLWTLFHHGLFRRICAWAGTWPQAEACGRYLTSKTRKSRPD